MYKGHDYYLDYFRKGLIKNKSYKLLKESKIGKIK